ncbi:MAG: acetolactate synthase large subunit [Bacillota bacterium]|nr:acetolactate synthase large subunit [Bacillota bacterium]
MKGYEYIANLIKDYGITHYFYQEGVMRYTYKELDKIGIRGILAHSENAAGYMADGYARAAQRASVVFAQNIGAGNLAGGIYDAFMANSPVIAFTGKKEASRQYKNSYQETDHRLLYEGITKFNPEILEPSQTPFIVRQLFKEAVAGKPQPVHVDIPDRMGTDTEIAEMKEPYTYDKSYCGYPAHRSAAVKADVDKAAGRIHSAERPVIVCGRGASISGAADAVHKLAAKAGIPILITPDAKTMFDEDDPLWCGIVGEYGMSCSNHIAREADLVIFIGTQNSDQTTCNWTCPPIDTRIVQIDIDERELGKNYPDTVGLAGDARTIVEQLIPSVSKASHKEWYAHCRALFDETMAEYDKYKMSNKRPINPGRMCSEIGKALPDDAVLVGDTGYSAVWSANFIKMKDTQTYFRAAGSLGWAYPASLGIKCALPDQPVFCFAGDGAMYYHLCEIETACRYGINTITLINNNNILAQSAYGNQKDV